MREDREILCSLVTENNEVKLKFADKLGEINFTKDNQEEMKKLFSNLLSLVVDSKVKVKLKNDSNDKDLHSEVCEEYLKQLNEELKAASESYEERYNIEK